MLCEGLYVMNFVGYLQQICGSPVFSTKKTEILKVVLNTHKHPIHNYPIYWLMFNTNLIDWSIEGQR